MKILSLFDGMACGMLAMQAAGITVDRYVAFEVDKYAVQTSSHNFPMIEHRGDVFQADFTEFIGFDFVLAGFPCTKFSIAQKNDRETEPYSGEGWLLFEQAWRAVCESKPQYFLFENNKSMAKAVQKEISKIVGFEPICINSALVSAQNRQRLYWVGKRNLDGTYSRVKVEQPDDRGILLKDILESGETFYETTGGKSFALPSSYYKTGENPFSTFGNEQRRQRVVEPVASTVLNINPSGKGMNGSVGRIDAKSRCLTTNKGEGQKIIVPVRLPEYGSKDKARPLGANYQNNCGGFEHRMFSDNPNKQQVDMIAEQVTEPVCMRYQRSEEAKKVRKQYEAGEIHHGFRELSELHPRTDGKTNTLSTVLKDNPICEPVCVAERGRYVSGGIEQRYEAREDGKTNVLTTVQKDNQCCEPVRVGALPRPNGELSTSQAFRVYSADGKSVNITAGGGGAGGKTGLYAIPVEFDGEKPIKATSGADGKTYTVYEVKGGQITIKGKQYPIKLADGFYIIRKLTVSECKRLQTVPEWYEFPVSDSQAYKMLGNGWTVEVIAHLIRATQAYKMCAV